jgi:hypothetical protein
MCLWRQTQSDDPDLQRPVDGFQFTALSSRVQPAVLNSGLGLLNMAAAKSRGQNLLPHAAVNQALHHFPFAEIVGEAEFDRARLIQC